MYNIRTEGGVLRKTEGDLGCTVEEQRALQYTIKGLRKIGVNIISIEGDWDTNEVKRGIWFQRRDGDGLGFNRGNLGTIELQKVIGPRRRAVGICIYLVHCHTLFDSHAWFWY